MKKTIKSLVALGLILMMCVSFTGCTLLDDLKDAQAFYDEQGNIVVNGEVYKRLPECTFLWPDYDYTEDEKVKYINITEDDVPVLLSSFEGEYATLSCDENFFEVSKDYDGCYTFCKEDIYEEALKIIESGVTSTNYKYYAFNYEDSTDIERVLTPEECKALDNVSKEGKIIEDFEESTKYNEVSASIYAYEEKLPFESFRYYVIERDGKFYVQETVIPDGLEGAEKDKYIYDSYDAEYIWREVPDKYNSIFKKIMDAAELELSSYEYTDVFGSIL